jgi:hypothetical protein
MMYLIALIVPPLALLMQGRIFGAIINLVLFVLAGGLFVLSLGILHFITFPIWVLCVVWAIVVVHNDRSDARMREIARETMPRP